MNRETSLRPTQTRTRTQKQTQIQTPGSVVASKCTGSTTPSPPDASIRHAYQNNTLHLPVMASTQTLSAQNLLLLIKPLWVIRIWLVLLYPLHPPVVLRQREVCMCCVWVQCEITGIYRTEERGWITTVYLDLDTVTPAHTQTLYPFV